MLRALFQQCRRVLLFGVAGCVNTLVDFGVFTACAELLRLRPGLSHALGYLAGILCSFLLNRGFTFRDGHGHILRQAALFLLVNAVSLAVTSLLITALTAAALNQYAAKLVVTLISMCINYFGYKRLVFQIREKKKEDKRDE